MNALFWTPYQASQRSLHQTFYPNPTNYFRDLIIVEFKNMHFRISSLNLSSAGAISKFRKIIVSGVFVHFEKLKQYIPR